MLIIYIHFFTFLEPTQATQIRPLARGDLQEAFACEDIICTGNDDDGITVHTSSREAADREYEIAGMFMDKWQVRPRFVHVRYIDEIPRNSSGKVLYSKL